MVKQLGGWPYLLAGLGLAGAILAAGLGLSGLMPGQTAYWTAAVGASVFYGFASLAVWRQAEPKDDTGLPLWPWRVHKWSFNSAGAFAGWYAVDVLRLRLAEKPDLSVGVFMLGLVALLGVSGWLPVTVVGFSRALGQLASRAVEAVGK